MERLRKMEDQSLGTKSASRSDWKAPEQHPVGQLAQGLNVFLPKVVHQSSCSRTKAILTSCIG